MKVDRSLKEVWDWKEKSYLRTKGRKLDEAIRDIKKDAEEVKRTYNLRLKTLSGEIPVSI
jgi:hypothetical protein